MYSEFRFFIQYVIWIFSQSAASEVTHFDEVQFTHVFFYGSYFCVVPKIYFPNPKS